MTYASDLLAQAKHLAANEPRRPKQASLRRAISSAYYSLFHLLVTDAAAFMVKGAGATAIRPIFQRAFVHGHMKNVAKSFAGGELRNRWKGVVSGEGGVPPALRQLASAFVELQEARHDADYDLSRRFARVEVNELIEVADRASRAWREIKNSAEGHAFLTALLVYDATSRP